MKHFVHYLSREIKKSKKFKNDFFMQEQSISDGFERPMFHITRRKYGPSKEIEKGSVIWLFSILKSPWGNLPPCLDAKFIVEKIEHLPNGETKFYANSQSRWYPIFDVTEVIKTLITVDKNNKQSRLWADTSKPLGFYLQSIRRLYDAEKLLEYSDSIINKKFDFISYRIKDGTELAFRKTENLIKSGEVIFWDRYCLPRRLAERREYVDDKKLNDYLLNKIHNSNKVYGIETPKYFEKNCYAQKEALFAKKQNKYISITSKSAENKDLI